MFMMIIDTDKTSCLIELRLWLGLWLGQYRLLWHDCDHTNPAITMWAIDSRLSIRSWPIEAETKWPQLRRHFKPHFLEWNVRISIEISLKSAHKGPTNNIPSLFQIMAWHRPGDKPLSEPMMVSLLTHICVTRPQWVNSPLPGQNGHNFADVIFRCIFLKEKFCIFIKSSLKFVPNGPIDNKPPLV